MCIWVHGFGLDFDTTSNGESVAKRDWISSTYCMFLRGEWTMANNNDDDDTAAVHTLLSLLPPLKSLCTHVDNIENKMNMEALVKVLQHSQGTLKEFRGPTDYELCGSEADFRSLLQSLRLLKALDVFEWNADGYCTDVELEAESEEEVGEEEDLEQEPNIVAINIDDVLQALMVANAPLVTFSLGIYYRRPSPLALQGFLHGKKSTLRTLEANVNKWDHATVQTMKAFLANDDCRVEVLTIAYCTFSTKRFPIVKDLLGAALDTNSVRTFEIRPYALTLKGEDTDKDELLFEFYHAVTALLKTNTSLRSFVVAYGSLISKALVPRIAKAFVNALQENTSLKWIELPLIDDRQRRDQPTMREMDYYLEMNRLGRKNVLENGPSMTRSDWVDQMASAKSNLNWIFFLLRTNPMLCQSSTTPLTQPTGDATPSITAPIAAPSGAASSVSGSPPSIKHKSNGKRKRE